ncbi:carcinine hydrolase/isopenicillin-N N-acyltransferase family protein [Barnesiella intestinihominis]|uniref:carcinine hydrolase/isopenicillin-N N-acyltransferase family protein n=1 Tax=Barnesiella intestinihominis TaxID=487174 RepID=UPI0026DD8426|nr:carcinine hydrolase/isopenicillin-N N-acyltransferase family protein [Barnesiella intestinihominis]
MRKLLSVIIVYLVGWIPMFPCTSAVVSGRVTPDGRPLLWKHRDASDLNNRIVHFEAEGGKLEFVGLVNGVDTMADEVWAGYNTSGFAIMNTASYNLKNDTSSLSDREGVVMKQALGECRTVEDFARLLYSLPRPIGVEANFGVVDALGGAAYFEVNSYEVFRYDVKDSPDGYLLRTNYSVSGRPNEGYGYIRYDNAARLFSRAASERSITPEWITGICSRSFYHTLLGRDFTTDTWVVDQDFIPRRSTSASVVIEGVKSGESPVFTTMWTMLGYPPCSVVLPVWIGCEYGVPTLLQGSEDSVRSPLCEWSNRLKNKVFSLERGSGPHYLHMALLYNPESNGYAQRLLSLEKEIYAEGRIVLDEARRKGEWDNERIGSLLGIVQQKIVILFGQILK